MTNVIYRKNTHMDTPANHDIYTPGEGIKLFAEFPTYRRNLVATFIFHKINLW